MKKQTKKEQPVSLGNIIGGKINFEGVDEVLQREVKQFGGGSAHVLIPKKHIGKKAIITIHKKQEENKND